ncbi:hypothetical protein [Pantoea agglomerans]|uniref:Uncharacterized protein n=1 Tax=Enterobacter agglomerans TaxID=549 RepID=A0ACC5PWS2_ENTAG|nr:hypothetical protein [Pantoea agglomerans]MBD8129152.1 hypothetical protein [Pantoea agglomerans]MBD8242531.1 hypothetical protein [Pantoea agglomerans]WVL84701.1 hypothetical protein IFU02_019865 [Pantoea agglomerans]
MVKSKLLKVKRWVNLNEAAQRLSLALDEQVNALELLELALDGELVLSVKLPFDKKFLARKIIEKHTPMLEYHKGMFKFQNEFFGKHFIEGSDAYVKAEMDYLITQHKLFLDGYAGEEMPDEFNNFDCYCNSIKNVEWDYGDIEYLDDNIFELSMLGAEEIDVMWLIRQNKGEDLEELTNLNGVVLRDRNGSLYNLQEKFDEVFIKNLEEINTESKDENSLIRYSRKFRVDPRHYFPAGTLPAGSEIGMSPANMSKFEAKLLESDSSFPDEQLLLTMGSILKEITTSGAKKWTQGALATAISEKKIINLSERTINGIFSEANKRLKSIS